MKEEEEIADVNAATCAELSAGLTRVIVSVVPLMPLPWTQNRLLYGLLLVCVCVCVTNNAQKSTIIVQSQQYPLLAPEYFRGR